MKFPQANKIGILLVATTLVLLFLGLTLPCIEVSSKMFGFIPLGSDKKSILGVIDKLLTTNFLLAMLLVVFSIIIPVLKLGLTLFLLIVKNSKNNYLVELFVHNVGKWSMVDVFSMAIIVSMLTFDNLRIKIFSTEGELMAGFYFFLSYGLLSITTTYFLNRQVRNEPTRGLGNIDNSTNKTD